MRVFGEFFGTEVRVFAVSSGTAANSLALATFCPPWGTVLTHAEAHIERDECGAPEFFTGGAKLSLIGGAGAKIAAARSRRAARLVRTARAWRAAAHAVDHPGDRTRRDLHAAGNPRAREDRSRTRHGRAHGRRALRQRAGGPERVAGRAHLEGGRRRAVVWRHQEWRHECRGRGVFRSDPRRGLRVPPQARRAAALQGTIRRRAASRLPRKWYVAAQCRAEPTGSRHASPPRRRSCSASRSPPTRCS